jgi:hypothetical protein
MEQINIASKDYDTLKGLIVSFKEIDGDEDKSLELEDFYDLVSLARTINSIIEESIQPK